MGRALPGACWRPEGAVREPQLPGAETSTLSTQTAAFRVQAGLLMARGQGQGCRGHGRWAQGRGLSSGEQRPEWEGQRGADPG